MNSSEEGAILLPALFLEKLAKQVNALRYPSDKHCVNPEREIKITMDDEC